MMTEDFIRENIEKGKEITRNIYRSEIFNHILLTHPYRIRKNKDGDMIAYMKFGNHEFAIGTEAGVDWQINQLVDIEMKKYKD